MLRIFFIIIAVLADQLLKSGVEKGVITQKDIDSKGKYFKNIRIKKSHNHGFLFGKYSKNKKLVKFIPFFVVVYFIFSMLFNNKNRRRGILNFLFKITRTVAYILIIAGGISNVADKFRRGYVVDYIIYNKGLMRNIIFNLADVYIVFGSFIYMLGGILFG